MLREGRRLLANLQQALLFAMSCQFMLAGVRASSSLRVGFGGRSNSGRCQSGWSVTDYVHFPRTCSFCVFHSLSDCRFRSSHSWCGRGMILNDFLLLAASIFSNKLHGFTCPHACVVVRITFTACTTPRSCFGSRLSFCPYWQCRCCSRRLTSE